MILMLRSLFFTAVALMTMVGAQAQAEEGVFGDTSQALTPISFLHEGSYKTKNGYFRKLAISPWVEGYIADGLISYGGASQRFSVLLHHDEENLFSGTGTLRVRFTDGSGCGYTMRLRIVAFEEGLFIRSWAPGQVSWQCDDAEVESIHREPYILQTTP